jgi:hypothetical protein
MSLQSRFVLLYGIGGSFFLALLTFLVFASMEKEMVERLREQFEIDAKIGVQAIERNLQQQSEQFQFSASIPMFRAMHFHEMTRNKAALRNDIRQLELYFLQQQKNQVNLHQIRLFDEQGWELLRIEEDTIADDLADMSASPDVQNGLLLAPGESKITLEMQDERVEHMVWWVPVHTAAPTEHNAQALMSFAFTFDSVRQQVISLVQDDHTLVCLMGEHQRILAGNAGQKQCWTPSPQYWQTRKTIELPGITWRIQLSVNPEFYLDDVYRLRWIVFGVFFPLVTLLTMLTVYLITRRLVQPLHQVSERLKQLARGNLRLPDIHYQGKDEIADLIDSSQRLKSGMEASIAQANAIAAGDYSQQAILLSRHDQLGQALMDMTHKLAEMSRVQAADSWLKAAFAKLNEAMRGAQSLEKLSQSVLSMLIKQIDAKVGLFYFYDDRDGMLKLTASYAYEQSKSDIPRQFEIGEGLVGQVAAEQEFMLIGEVPQNYIQIDLGVACIVPRVLLLLPLVYEGQTKGVLELGSCHVFRDIELDFLKQAAPVIGIELYAAESRTRLETLLEQGRLDGLY